jgi:hypothetical protein
MVCLLSLFKYKKVTNMNERFHSYLMYIAIKADYIMLSKNKNVSVNLYLCYLLIDMYLPVTLVYI